MPKIDADTLALLAKVKVATRTRLDDPATPKVGDIVQCGGCGADITVSKGQAATFLRTHRPTQALYCNHKCQYKRESRLYKARGPRGPRLL